MCINCCLIMSVILVVNTKINLCTHVDSLPRLVPSNLISNFHKNGLKLIPPILLEGDKRASHRDIKYYKDRRMRQRVSTTAKPLNKPQILPKIPSVYLEPPTTAKHYWNCKSKRNPLREKLRHGSITESTIVTKHRDEIRPNYVRDHAPSVSQQEVQETTGTEIKKDQNINENESNEQIRLDFHVHGHQGPDSYIFGYDTGPGKNRLFRLEEKHENGTVTGHYGYYDARGKLRKIYYSSDPATGYEANTNGHTFRQS